MFLGTPKFTYQFCWTWRNRRGGKYSLLLFCYLAKMDAGSISAFHLICENLIVLPIWGQSLHPCRQDQEADKAVHNYRQLDEGWKSLDQNNLCHWIFLLKSFQCRLDEADRTFELGVTIIVVTITDVKTHPKHVRPQWKPWKAECSLHSLETSSQRQKQVQRSLADQKRSEMERMTKVHWTLWQCTEPFGRLHFPRTSFQVQFFADLAPPEWWRKSKEWPMGQSTRQSASRFSRRRTYR